MAEAVNSSVEKRPRKRLKKLMVDICRQVEFYFSDANLRNDRFLQREMAKSDHGYVSVNVIADFNKMKSMTTDRKMVAMAIQQSSLLELNEDKTMLRRKVPVGSPKYDPDDCMIYVECLPKKTDHDWLQKTFSHCGRVVYVSLPRYRSTNDIKGFAFVEFETPQEAATACELMNNPPPDARSKAGKFPTMRGRKRIVPLNFDSSLKSGEAAATKDQQQRKPEGRSAARKDRDSRKVKDEKEDVREGLKPSGRTEVEKQGQRRKHRDDDLPQDTTCPGNPNISEHREKKLKNSDQKTSEETRKRHGDAGDQVDASALTKKARKRSRDDGDDDESEEVVSKSAKRRSSLKGSESKDGRRAEEKVKRSEGREHEGADEAQEETPEERMMKVLQMGRKMMKRKRSLSEGDKWAVRFREEEEEAGEKQADSGTEEGAAPGTEEGAAPSKKVKREPREGDGVRRESAADTSHASDLDKKKRSRKKKIGRQLQEEEDALFLRVISKREWLNLREEYLDLQKKCLARMKHPYRDQAQISEAEGAEECEAPGRDKSSGPEYVRGAVLKLSCLNATVTRKDIKDYLEAWCPVAYIDLPDGAGQGHVRFHTAEGPRTLLSKDTGDAHIALTPISDEEEKAYWEKLWLDRENKLKSKHTKKKKRGASKVQQKEERALASKAKTHIRFDE